MGQHWYSEVVRPICVKQMAGLVLAFLTLAGCATRSDNWWDENGAARSGDGSYVAGTPLPPPNRDGAQYGSNGTYVVKKGETLYQVSREQNVPIRSLIDANNLDAPYDLRAGQRLKIPMARFHVVAPGDTVYSISRTYGVDMSTLTSANHVPPPYTIKVGQRLQLPSKVNNQVAANVDEQNNAPPSGVPMSRPDAEYTSPSAQPLASPGATTPYKAPLPAPPVPAGDFIWPAQGRIISAYGAKEGGTHNDGINIAVPAGSSVKASQNGVVAYAGNELKGYGNLLLIRHANGWMTAYAHNSKLLVKRGDTVKRGQTIAQAGSTGSVTSPQVHFELRKGAKAVDPRTMIGS